MTPKKFGSFYDRSTDKNEGAYQKPEAEHGGPKAKSLSWQFRLSTSAMITVILVLAHCLPVPDTWSKQRPMNGTALIWAVFPLSSTQNLASTCLKHSELTSFRCTLRVQINRKMRLCNKQIINNNNGLWHVHSYSACRFPGACLPCHSQTQ